MEPPSFCVFGETSVVDFLDQFLLYGTLQSVPVIDARRRLLGMADIRDAWNHVRTRSRDPISRWVHPPAPWEALDAATTLADVVILLNGLAHPVPSLLPVVSQEVLVGEVRVSEVLHRVDKMDVAPMPSRTAEPTGVRVAFEVPVLRFNGRRAGRTSRVAVDTRSFRLTHLVVRLDGRDGREVVLEGDFITTWGELGLGTLLTETDFTSLPDFSICVAAPGSPCELTERLCVPETSACMARGTRLWAGARCLGRLLHLDVDESSRQILRVGYQSGLLFPETQHLPRTALRRVDDERIDVEPRIKTRPVA
jgi:hypothetical protein